MPKIVDRDEYRRELLDKCLSLFSKIGYGNVTIREIARELEVSTGTLYHYFPTKKSILESLLEHVSVQGISKYKSIINGSKDVKVKIELLSNYLLENEEYFKNVILLAVDLFRNSPAWKVDGAFTKISLQYRSLISEELQLSEEISKSFFIFLVGLVFHRILTPDHISYKTQVSMMRDLMLNVAVI